MHETASQHCCVSLPLCQVDDHRAADHEQLASSGLMIHIPASCVHILTEIFLMSAWHPSLKHCKFGGTFAFAMVLGRQHLQVSLQVPKQFPCTPALSYLNIMLHLQLDDESAVADFKRSRRRLLVLGYNATLTTAVEAPRQPTLHFDQIQASLAACMIAAWQGCASRET